MVLSDLMSHSGFFFLILCMKRKFEYVVDWNAVLASN